MKRDTLASLACLVSGAAIWLAISAATGRREAWDSSAYFSIGLPLVAAVSFAVGYWVPQRSWRWGIAPLAGQLGAMLVTEGPGNLLPLGIVVFAVLSIPSVVAARIGAGLRARRVL